jgi:hypothetical protein
MRLKFGTVAANVWGRGFLKSCRKTMTPLVNDMKSLENDIKREAQALFDERVESLPDKQGRMILAMCSLVLAAYRQLKQWIGDPKEAFKAVRMTFKKTYATPMRWYFRLWLLMCRDPVGSLQSKSMARQGQRMYGKSMEFVDENSDDSADMLVTRCAYNQFFVEHDEPSLALLVCAWDRNWMDVVDQSSRPVRTERSSTISTGGECCRFRFIRDEDKSGKETDDVVLVKLRNFMAHESE